MQLLRKGSRGDAVRSLQALLNSRGANLTVDGIFGTLTENSVIAFQLQNGLKTDGIVGEKTWGKLLSVDGGDKSDSVGKSPESAVSKASPEGKIQTFSLKKDGETYISKDYQVKDFRSKCGSDIIFIDVDFIKNVLQKITDHFNIGKADIISGYRSDRHNINIRRTPQNPNPAQTNSNHRYNAKIALDTNNNQCNGSAIDFKIKGKTPLEVCRYCESIGIKGIIQYPTWTHIDARQNKYWATCLNGIAKQVSRF
ncbi:MAG: peptidoglycan-binding protein [Firmicutes bacterium]|nr:peptidoglycan-binding protein [Bacillota bacterium]